MSQPMIVWCVIAGVLLCALVFNATWKFQLMCHLKDKKKIRFLELGEDWGMSYCPGDTKYDDDDLASDEDDL